MQLGESFEETARREVLEETGLVVGTLHLFYLHSGRHTFYEYPDGNQVYMAGAVFTTREFSGELITDTVESFDVAWFSTDDLPNISPNQQPVLQFHIENK